MTLQVRGLTKSYGARQVLRDVDLSVADGEIHALLGPNGSGKSTLIGCLSGSVLPDAGRITLDGVELVHTSPAAAMAAGIGVIYQHFSLVDGLSVADNIFLGREIHRMGRIDHKAQDRLASDLLAPFGRPIHPRAPVSTLRVGDRQLVEIAKALHRRPRVLVLDEPTAALGDSEARLLGSQISRLRDERLAILYVTHILDEVFDFADRVTVVRDGAVVLSQPIVELDPPRVVAAISPNIDDRDGIISPPAVDVLATPALELDGVVVDGIGPVSLAVRRGEIVSVFGLLGSGRTEIVEAIHGIRRLSGGEMRVNGELHRPSQPSDALRAGVGLVAGDRLRQSMFDRLPAVDNMLLPHMRRIGRHGRRDPAAEARVFGDVAARLDLRPRDPRIRGWAFSGGNQQKLAVGRWLVPGAGIDILLLDEPTQGIDVGARADLYGLLRDLASNEGRAILFTSSDPDETVALADRTLVLRRGRIVAESAGEFDRHMLLGLAHGTTTSRLAVTGESLTGV